MIPRHIQKSPLPGQEPGDALSHWTTRHLRYRDGPCQLLGWVERIRI
jgi:hypothetical protein